MWKSTDFLRRRIVSDTEAGSLNLSYVCLRCGLFPIEDFIWWVTEEHGEKRKWWCAGCVGQYHWIEADRILTIQASSRAEDTWVCKANAPPAGFCDNLISALKLLANLQEKEKEGAMWSTMASRRAAGGKLWRR